MKKTKQKNAAKEKVKTPSKELKQQSSGPDISNDDTPFDFGGLPQRDLKKNLGCG